MYGGFLSASGRPLPVSDEAIKKGMGLCAALLEELPPTEDEKSTPSTSKSGFGGGFLSASGRPLPVSDEAVKKGMGLCAALLEDLSPTEDEKSTPNTSKYGFGGGFLSASGRPLPVSDEAIKKGMGLCAALLEDLSPTEDEKSTPSTSKSGFGGGFLTASGRPVTVSEEAIKIGKGLRAAPLEELPPAEDEKSTTSTTKSEFGGGFLTASGRPVTVSEEAIKQSKGICGFPGQETPGKGEALKKAFSFFNDEDDNTESSEELSPIIQWRVSLADRKIAATQSPPMSIVKAQRTLFQDCNDKANGNSGPSAISTPATGNLRGFSATGPGKKLFQEMNARSDTSDDALSDNEEPVFKRNKVEIDDIRENNYSGLATQEIIDSTIALLADEEMYPFASSSCLNETDLMTTPSRMHLLVPPATLSARASARESQGSRLSGRQLSRIKPSTGKLLSLRRENELSRMKYTSLITRLPDKYSEEEYRLSKLTDSILHLTPQNSREFRFDGINFFGEDAVLNNKDGILVADGVLLILGADNAVGVKEMASGFMCSPGVDPRLISDQWICNHYRWIVWTLASYERRLPSVNYKFGAYLTPENVLLRLKYRYDREIDLSQRSAIHRITEQDDVATKRMVLVVANTDFQVIENEDAENDGIKKSESGLDSSVSVSSPSLTLELTDGWYSIPAICDNSIDALIRKRKIRIGTKLIIAGAEFIGAEPCHPVESNGKSKIKIGSNCIRRVKWNTRLGYCKNPWPFPVSISSIISQGGPVSLLHVVVVRVYPLIYSSKDSEGNNTYLTVRNYEKLMKAREVEKLDRMEKTYAEVEKEFEENSRMSQGKKRMSSRRIRKDQIENMTVHELLNCIETHVDGAAIEASLPDGKLLKLQEARLEKFDKIKSDIQKECESRLKEFEDEKPLPCPLLKVRILDASSSKDKINDPRNNAVLSNWKPNEEFVSLLVEGQSFQISSLRPPPNYYSAEPCLNTSQSTKYIPLKLKNSEIIAEIKRTPLPYTKILGNGFSPLFGEFDTVGLVVHIESLSSSSQIVYFADAAKNILGVRLWTTLQDRGIDDIVQCHNFVAMQNLKWRAASITQGKIPTAFAQNVSIFTLRPKETAMKKAIDELKEQIKDLAKFAEICERKTCTMLNTMIQSYAMQTVSHLASEIQPTSAKNSKANGRRILESYGNPPPTADIQLSRSSRLAIKFVTPKRMDKSDSLEVISN